MNAASTGRHAGTWGSSTTALVGVVLLRIAVGWHLLYEGLAKLFDSGWTAAGYLRSSEWILADLFHWMAETPAVLQWVDFLNVWGLILIGAGLMLGVFTRAASLAGVVLLLLYYAAHPPLVGMSTAAAAEGSYLVVNKNIVEMFALLLLAALPSSGFAGLGRYVGAVLRKIRGKQAVGLAAGAVPAHREPEVLGRRELIASLATLPVLGGFAFAVLTKRKYDSHEENTLKGRAQATRIDAVSSPSRTALNAQTLDDLKAKVPHAKLGNLDVSRVILGGNLMNGYAHARDLIYVSPLVKAYHSTEKVLETLWLAEQCGMNALVINTEVGHHFVEEYHKQRTGDMHFIAQCRCAKITDRINRAIDLGARGAYIQQVSDLVDKGRFDDVAKTLDYLRRNGLVAGIGDHSIAPIKKCVEQGIEPDFCMKTFHHDDYWSARPDDEQKDNRYCDDHDETVEFMRTFDKPWIAFKVLAAGAIHPKDGFRHAFEKGADFVCVGVYDFQVVEDANIACDILDGDLKRARPWKALA